MKVFLRTSIAIAATALAACSAGGNSPDFSPGVGAGTSGATNGGGGVGTSGLGGTLGIAGSGTGAGGTSGTPNGGVGAASGASGSGGTSAVPLPPGCLFGRQGCPCASSNPGICQPGLTCTPQAAPTPDTCCNGSDCKMPSGTVAPPSVTATCVAGQRGCLCDSTGACAAGLACTPQTAPNPNLCCNGSDCSPATISIGGTCGTAAGQAKCTPGVTVPAASGSNDSCGYSASDFNESTILCGINAVGGGSQAAVIQVFFADEHAIPLGCATANFPVTPLSSNPQAVSYPQTGDPACVDTSGRPLRPVLFITDITADPTCTSGDQQKGGKAYDPVAIFGTWKVATEGAGNVGAPATADPSSDNAWNLGPGADPVPAAATNSCQGRSRCECGGPSAGRAAFGAELRFEAGLISGHSYRLQVMLHDGDQGADSGEACAVFCAGTGTSPCPNGQCG
jgi:hypothetical protein